VALRRLLEDGPKQ